MFLIGYLGFLFRAQPSLLTAEPSSQIMDDIFASEDEDARSRLLKIMQDFLLAEADKHATKDKDSGKSYAILVQNFAVVYLPI